MAAERAGADRCAKLGGAGRRGGLRLAKIPCGACHRGTECEFRATTLWNRRRAGMVGGTGRTARLAVAERGMRFSRKDPVEQTAGREGWDGRGYRPDGTAGGGGAW